MARNPDLFTAPETPAKKATRSKYGNRKTWYAGREYHSQKEADRAQQLDLLKKAKEIINWWPQVRIPVSEDETYICDFLVLLPDLSVRIEDVKGYLTKEYKHKRRLFEKRYPGWKINEC